MERISLVGLDIDGKPARISKNVVHFNNVQDTLSICNRTDKFCELHTQKAMYKLIKHAKLNIYTSTCNGHKVQVSLKKVVGELRYW